MASAIVIGGSSTQSRGKRPGKSCRTIRCSGAHEWLEDGRKVLSWPMGQYGGLLGYPADDNELTRGLIHRLHEAVYSGEASLGSYSPILEQRLADKLALLYAPYLHSPDIGVRFFSNGTDACQAAVALARHRNTDWPSIISIGYHGGSSPVFAFDPQNSGILLTNSHYRHDIEFGNTKDVSKYIAECSALIVEVPSVENEKKATEYLKWLSDICAKSNVCFIVDDIVTGFRYAPAGALEYYSNMNYLLGQGLGRMVEWTQNIQADFICLGKALSTYGKVSALLGPADIMQALTDKVFASYTYNDHPLGFVDALWTLEQYEKHHDRLYLDASPFIPINSILKIGASLKSGLNKLFAEFGFPAKCIGHPARSAVIPTDDGRMLDMLLAALVNGHDILIHKPNFVTLSHQLSDVEKTLAAVEEILNEDLAI